MKKIHILCMALFAMFALSAMFASMSAAAEWLVEELPITELLSAETVGELTLIALEEPIIGTVEVLCSGILDGTISPAGLDSVTEVLSLLTAGISSVALTGTALECANVKACPTPLVWPDGLPWASKLVSLTDDVTEATEVGFYVQCMGIIGEPTDLCVQKSVLGEIANMAAGNPLITTDELNTSNCTTAGANKGSIFSDEPAEIHVLEGLLLSVS